MIPPAEIEAARATPAGWAWLCSRHTWQPARHLLLLTDIVMEHLARGNARLLVTTPPRHGKTHLLGRAVPAWYLGLRPTARVVVVSHSGDLAEDSCGMAQRDFSEYGPEVFGCGVDPRHTARDHWEVERHGGTCRAFGIGSKNFTGRGADLLIIDDYCPTAEAALSQTQRDAAWQWYEAVAHPRLEPGASVVVFATRWHEDDLAGRIMAAEPGKWTVVRLPALAERGDILGRSEGEALWPERWPRKALESIRATKGSFWWSAMYQGSPVPEGGGIFKRAWWEHCRYRIDRAATGDRVVLGAYSCPVSALLRFGVVDLATSLKTSADYTVMGSFGLTPERPPRLVVLDVDRARREGPDILPMVDAKRRALDLGTVWIEDSGYQLLTIQEARKQGIPVRAYGRKLDHDLVLAGDKVAVYYAATPLVEAGRLWFPVSAEWLADVEAELSTAPYAPHDDVADVVAVACLLAGHLRRGSRTIYTPAGGPDDGEDGPKDPWEGFAVGGDRSRMLG